MDGLERHAQQADSENHSVAPSEQTSPIRARLDIESITALADLRLQDSQPKTGWY